LVLSKGPKPQYVSPSPNLKMETGLVSETFFSSHNSERRAKSINPVIVMIFMSAILQLRPVVFNLGYEKTS
jgi:hypothetical protein